jgi:hypothetical protein
MAELPAVMLFLISFTVAKFAVSKRVISYPLLFLSGVLSATALHIKFTAAIWGPACFIACAWHGWRTQSKSAYSQQTSQIFARAAYCLLAWLFGFIVIFLLLVKLSPNWDLNLLIGNHLSSAKAPQAELKVLGIAHFITEIPGLTAFAMIGSFWLWKIRAFTGLIFASVAFGTALFVHFFHRPFWYYYYLHFEVPLLFLATYGVAAAWPRFIFTGDENMLAEGRMVLFSLAIALFVSFDAPRAVKEIKEQTQLEKVTQNGVIGVLGGIKNPIKWGYSKRSYLLYHCGIDAPPELAILPEKRFWTGAIDEAEVTKIVERYSCELLVLERFTELKEKCWNDLVSRFYVPVFVDDEVQVFMRRAD